MLLALVLSALAQAPPSSGAPAPTEIGAPPDAPSEAASTAPGAGGFPPPATPPGLPQAPPSGSDGPPRAAVDPRALLGDPAGPALTGDALRASTHAAAKLLRCVVCQGLSVADSPSETARAMRDEVEALVAQGYDTDQVLTYFEASYGEFVRLEPKSDGFGAVVWVAPVAVLAAGAAWIALSVRHGPPAQPARPAAADSDDVPLADPDDPYLRRVREETA